MPKGSQFFREPVNPPTSQYIHDTHPGEWRDPRCHLYTFTVSFPTHHHLFREILSHAYMSTHTHTHTPFILKDEEIEHIEFKLSLKFQNSNLDLLHCPL